MGQYYQPIIIFPDGSSVTFDNHQYGCGIKLMEHSWIGNEFVNAVYSKILSNPRRVAWIGDYSNDDYETCKESYTRHLSFEEFMKYYDDVWGEQEKKEKILPSCYNSSDLNIVNHETKNRFLVNHDQKEYLDLGCYIERCTVKEGNWAGYCVNPLPLLTACGNGRGGGDFHNSPNTVGYENVGIWAFDILELSKQRPDGYAEVHYTFIEGAI